VTDVFVPPGSARSLPEEWRDIAHLPGHRVSDQGNVVGPKGPRKLGTRRSGHKVLCTRKGTFTVHSLVLAAFVGPRPAGMDGRHLDGNPANNRVENLAWGTRKQNQEDMVAHGRSTRGTRAHGAILTEAAVREIRALRQQGLTYKKIAERLETTFEAVRGVLTGRTWAWLS
jgi:hypothetical protein